LYKVQGLGLNENRGRIRVPDVGGGFGGKNGAYPEDVAVADAAQKLGRPVKGVEDRREKSKRGELIVASPAGYVKGEDRLEKDPDRRVQERVLLVFSKFFELGSARQTLLWFLEHTLQVPVSAPRGQGLCCK